MLVARRWPVAVADQLLSEGTALVIIAGGLRLLGSARIRSSPTARPGLFLTRPLTYVLKGI